MIRDPEAESEWDNPVEAKYHRLARGMLRGVGGDPALKPNRGELARIQEALSAPALDASMPRDLQDLLWKFRYSLTSNKQALTRFLGVVDWDVEEDVKEATALLARWAPVDTEVALRLLSFDFPYRPVREHAVSALRRSTDEELVLYLLQLVQALRYEEDLQGRPGDAALPRPAAHKEGTAAGGANGSQQATAGAVGPAAAAAGGAKPSSSGGGGGAYRLSPLADFLVERACGSLELANFLHWYLTVESGDARMGHVFARVHEELSVRLQVAPTGRAVGHALRLQAGFLAKLAQATSAATSSKKDSVAAKIEKLNAVLAPGGAFGEMCALPEPVPFPLHPRILVAGVQPGGGNIFKSALYPTVITHAVHPASPIDWTAPAGRAGLKVADAAAAAAAAAMRDMQAGVLPRAPSHGGSARGLLPRMKSGVGYRARGMSPSDAEAGDSATAGAADGASPSPGGGAPPVALHQDADETTSSAIASAVAHAMPPGTPPAVYKVMFKNGDDMRQDQLIIQMIRLMDTQLKRVGLDLQLTPYRVLATSPSSGMLELVLSSKAVSAVLAEHSNDIQRFFRAHHPAEGAEYGIDPEVMTTYVKSAAGYAVITYLLGIGDRHLDNIMLRSDGHLFHIDFGYIFGRDPKPFPAAVRMTKEMIDGMGGPNSRNYDRFKRYCCQAYNILRKSANLVLSLLNLMRDAGIEALAEAPDTTLAKVRGGCGLEATGRPGLCGDIQCEGTAASPRSHALYLPSFSADPGEVPP